MIKLNIIIIIIIIISRFLKSVYFIQTMFGIVWSFVLIT